MIEGREILLIGRDEPRSDQTAAVLDLTEPLRERAQRAWLYRWEDKASRWDEWNVMALLGGFGRWSQIDFLTYEGLGRSWCPHLTGQIRYTPLIDAADPVSVNRFDPPILLRTTPLLSEPTRKPHVHYPYDRLLTLEAKLDRRGLLDHPMAVSKRSFERLLVEQGLRISEDGYGRVEIARCDGASP